MDLTTNISNELPWHYFIPAACLSACLLRCRSALFDVVIVALLGWRCAAAAAAGRGGDDGGGGLSRETY